MTALTQLQAKLQEVADPAKVEVFKRFFKTDKGQYGEGDIFLGISTPQQREIIKDFKELSLEDIQAMLHSKIHEYRMSSLLILVNGCVHFFEYFCYDNEDNS